MNPTTTPSATTDLTPTMQKFGNDVVVAEPSQTNTQNYTVLDSDMAKQDYLTKNKFLDQEKQNFITQSLMNQANTAATKTATDANSSTKSSTDALTKATDALTGGSNDSTSDPYTDKLNQQNQALQEHYTQTQSDLVKASTTAGLSADQQAQLTQLASQYDTIITKQNHANDFYNGSVEQGTIRSGSSRYATTMAMGTVTQAVNEGIAKITKLTGDKQAALSKMQEGFVSDNVKAVSDAYKAYSDMSKEITDNIKTIQDHVDKLHSQYLEDQKYSLQVYQQQQKDSQDARDFAYKNNINSQAYQIGSKVFDTATGQEIPPGQYDQSSVQVIDPNSAAEKDYVKTLSTKYADTVFPTMTAQQAQDAMKYSKIYREQVRPPEYISNPSGSKGFKFDSAGTSRLLASGLTNDEISAIQTNLNNGSDINTILSSSSLSDEEKKSVKDVMGGVTANQAGKQQDTYGQVKDYKAWIWQNFPRENLSAAAKASGFKSDKNTDNAVDKYITSITSNLKAYESQGSSDQEIMSAITDKIVK